MIQITSLDVSKDGVGVSVSTENDCEAITWLIKNEDKLVNFGFLSIRGCI